MSFYKLKFSVVGFWVTMELLTQEHSQYFDNPISSRIKPIRKHLEELVNDTVFAAFAFSHL